MRLLGNIEGINVIILIDSESTNNFLDPSIVSKPINCNMKMLVKVANGEIIGS